MSSFVNSILVFAFSGSNKKVCNIYKRHSPQSNELSYLLDDNFLICGFVYLSFSWFKFYDILFSPLIFKISSITLVYYSTSLLDFANMESTI